MFLDNGHLLHRNILVLNSIILILDFLLVILMMLGVYLQRPAFFVELSYMLQVCGHAPGMKHRNGIV